MFEKIKQKVTTSTEPAKEAVVDPNQNGGLPVMSGETIRNAQPPERPDDPNAIEPKAPLCEAESILAWLKTQPSTPENRALRAMAGAVVDYLKAK